MRKRDKGARAFRETSYFFPDILIYNSRKKNSSWTAGVKAVTAFGRHLLSNLLSSLDERNEEEGQRTMLVRAMSGEKERERGNGGTGNIDWNIGGGKPLNERIHLL
ncbi:hypothetical protein K0M31_000505, partial [Melipona bicolor]